jgi:hypothetical protein
MSFEQYVSEFVPEAGQYSMNGAAMRLKFDLIDEENGTYIHDSANMDLRLAFEDCKGLIVEPIDSFED